MALVILVTMAAPDTTAPVGDKAKALELQQVPRKYRNVGLAIVAISWTWAIFTIGSFMSQLAFCVWW